MSDVFILELGDDYGEILVEGVSSYSSSEEGLVEAGRIEDVVNFIKVKIQDVLKTPLIGMGLALRASLPDTAIMDSEQFGLEEFSVQFEIGLTTETGIDAAAVAKIIPKGGFNCTYKWKRFPIKNDIGVVG